MPPKDLAYFLALVDSDVHKASTDSATRADSQSEHSSLVQGFVGSLVDCSVRSYSSPFFEKYNRKTEQRGIWYLAKKVFKPQ